MTLPGQHPSLATTGRAGLRPPDDLYSTLEDCIVPLFRQMAGPSVGPTLRRRTVWDPAAGDGRIVALAEAFGARGIAQDLHNQSDKLPPRCRIETGVDFLATTTKRADLLVTNPPYDHERAGNEPTLAEKFVRHALELQVRNVVMFLALDFLASIKRYDLLAAGGSLRRVDVLVPRPTLYPAGVARRSSGANNYAWFHFDSGPPRGPAVVDLMKREGC